MPGIQYEFTVCVSLFLISILFIFSYVVSVTPSPHFEVVGVACSLSEHLLSGAGAPANWYSTSQLRVLGLAFSSPSLVSYRSPKPLYNLDPGKVCCLNSSCMYYVPYSPIDDGYNSSFHARNPSACNFKRLLDLSGDDIRVLIMPSLNLSVQYSSISSFLINVVVHASSRSGSPVQGAAIHVIVPGLWGASTVVESSYTDSDGFAELTVDLSVGFSEGDYVIIVTAYKDSFIGYSENEFRLESDGSIRFGRENVNFIQSHLYKHNESHIFLSLRSNSQGTATYTRLWFNGSQSPYYTISFTGAPAFYVPNAIGFKGPIFMVMNISLSNGEKAISFIEYPMLVNYGEINPLAESVTLSFSVIILDVIYIVEITYCHYER